MTIMDQDVVGIVHQLQDLAGKPPILPENLTRAKQLMRGLRQIGFTNMEVSELTNGGWSESTVKLYIEIEAFSYFHRNETVWVNAEDWNGVSFDFSAVTMDRNMGIVFAAKIESEHPNSQQTILRTG